MEGGDAKNRYRFAGKERLDDAELVNFGARWLATEPGRWMAPDPTQGPINGPQALNRFLYVDNNPLTHRDPDGNLISEVADVAFLVNDVINVVADPSAENLVWVAVDLACMAVDSVGEGAGLLAHSAEGAHEAAEVVHGVEEGVHAAAEGSHAAEGAAKVEKIAAEEGSQVGGKAAADEVEQGAKEAGANGGCFVAGTLVDTDRGFVAIEQVNVGDIVLGQDGQWHAVLAVADHVVDEIVEVRTDSGEVINATPGHPFYVVQAASARSPLLTQDVFVAQGVSWSTGALVFDGLTGWVGAGSLHAGDLLQGLTCTVTVGGVRPLARLKRHVYNLMVESAKTYRVGSLAITVHNGGCKDPGHTPDQESLKDIVNESTNGGRKPLSKADAETVGDWAKEVDYPGARAKPGDVASPSNWNATGGDPHVHLPGAGRGGHVPVEPGTAPWNP